MALESSFDFPDDLNTANPAAGDDLDEGDDHIRGIKNVIKNFAADLSGSPLNKSILSALFPVSGIGIVVTGSSGDPGNQIGGTWQCMGQLKTLATVDEDPARPGVFPDAYLYIWNRVS